MSAVGSHLLRRGLDAHAYMAEKEVKIDLPPWVQAMLGVDALIFVFILFMIEYTFGRLIPALIMIESPQDNIDFEPLPTEDTDDAMNKDPEQITRPTTQFITSSFRSSIKLLHSKGGFRSRFRGISIFIVNNLATQMVAQTLSGITGQILHIGVYTTIAAVICARLSLGWTLIVISEPSPKYWFRRMPSFKMWKKIVGPTALYEAATQIAVMIPVYLAIGLELTQDPKDVAKLPASEQNMIIVKSFGIFALGLVLAFFLVIPANITLTRVQASLLSDTEETIVPFDRTFGGKVVPEIVGGSGMVSMLDAWKTFDWAACVRLIKAYVKVVAMVFAVSILFTIILVAQCLLFAGKLDKVFVPVDGSN